ncbi:hypothetical protein F5Y17DRAFT_173330 [Xylariaceae sp. FL0594]|nr:hypothetical protein F5Y17DRAFT_173330 [Xylariaceae sp. FL0594]
MMPVPYRIPVPLRGGAGSNIEGLPNLDRRNDNGGSSSVDAPQDGSANGAPIIVVAVLISIIAVISIVAFVYFRRRRSQARRLHQQTGHLEPYSNTSAGARRRNSPQSAQGVSETNRTSAVSNIDRNTSIRSIMTLPQYTKTPQEDEQVLGRAGERDGVDTIIELPSAEQQEALRDEEMETLYQIRLTRRQQAAEREERRRLIREARERGDQATLADLRTRGRAQNDNSVIDDLREAQGEIRARRERAVSSVSYDGLGVARHDGSRIRANSTESERVGLLSDAASIALSTRSPSALSNRRVSDAGGLSLDTRSPSAQSYHGRMHSVGSVLTLDDNGDASPHSAATTPRLGSYHGRAGSSPEIIGETDLGESGMPPPDYEDVSLDDLRSGSATPMAQEPPPDYSGYGHEQYHGQSGSHGAESESPLPPINGDEGRSSSNRTSRGVGGVPQLPSLRIRSLPQIIIEPSTAYPTDRGR